MLFSRKPVGATNDRIITLPSSALHPLFGKVSYRMVGAEQEVMFSILMPSLGEGWQTGLALDASSSMRAAYGKVLSGTVPPAVRKDYTKRGWIREQKRDGATLPIFQPQAYEDAIAKGYLRWTENTVEPETRRFVQYLAENIDADGGTTLIYWACGKGDAIETVGDIRGEDCAVLPIQGPATAGFGTGTQLLPAVRYFEERFADAKNGIYVFITDGRIEDLAAVKTFCVDLAKRIEAGRRNTLKCVLIGLGPEIDESQMVELDDLDTGTDIDIWDHKIAADMRDITEIFAELVDESVQIAPMANIYDDAGGLVRRLTDGLPARVIFRIPQSARFFELEIPGQERIRQSLVAT
jgi:hypothetical protein